MSFEIGFSSAALAQELDRHFGLNSSHNLFVAFSGGLDSSALLHALINVDSIRADRVTALHVNHGMHPDADLWEARCGRRCAAWNVQFEAVRIKIPEQSGAGVEAAAREARYDWFASRMLTDSALLTAHHLQDQAETVLANLFRGTGIQGLGGIHPTRPLGRGRVWRPLIKFERESLLHYAQDHALQWIEDPSNSDLRYTRNVIRQSIVPQIQVTWPGLVHALGRTATICAETSTLLNELGQTDLKDIHQEIKPPYHTLSVTDLAKLDQPRCLNLLRCWFRSCGLEVPSKFHLDQLYGSMIKSTPRSTALLGWNNVELRCYRQWLYLSTRQTVTRIEPKLWCGGGELDIGHGRLLTVPSTGTGIRADVWNNGVVSIRSRNGGERVRLRGSGIHRKLKKLLQEHGIPPWQRNLIPLVYIDEDIAAIVGIGYCEPFAAQGGERGIVLQHELPEKNLKI